MIKSINSQNHNEFFKNENLNKLVELSLDNLDNDVFLNIITLIKLTNFDMIKKMIPQFKKDPDCVNIIIYDEILDIFNEIYSNINSSNLRGTFLELLTFKFINKRYNVLTSDWDCFIEIDGVKSEKTVDVFGFCDNSKGIICECKLSHNNFKKYHISNLNNIYNNSDKILLPYIITFSNGDMIKNKLIELVKEDFTNKDVYLGHIKIISNCNISDFFF